MMDNGHKRKLYNSTRRQVYVNLFLKGIKTLRNSIGKIILIIMMIGFYILMLSMEGNVEPAKPDTYKDATDYFGVFYFFAISFITGNKSEFFRLFFIYTKFQRKAVKMNENI